MTSSPGSSRKGRPAPRSIEHIKAHEADYDFFIFFSFRYHHSYHGARAVPAKAILVPTAERDSALGLGLYPPIFRGVRAFMYNSFEERALIQGVSDNQSVPGVVVGVGSEIPERSNAGRFRQKFEMRDRFAIYVGRIDENKGCGELFDFFEHYSASLVDGMHLVLIGTPHIPDSEAPAHSPSRVPRGSGQVRRDGRRGAADHAVVSREPVDGRARSVGDGQARARQREVRRAAGPVHPQQRGPVLRELSRSSRRRMRAIDTTPSLQAALGRNGRAFFERHYAWPVIEKKYVDMLQQLSKESAPQRDGADARLVRAAATIAAAGRSIVKQLPAGPYREREGRVRIFDVAESQPSSSQQAARQPSAEPKPLRPELLDRPRAPRRPTSETSGAISGDHVPITGGPRPPAAAARRSTATTAGGRRRRRQAREGRKRSARRDQRRGRPQRRGRRPGGGGGGAR